ncbi:hypothetical protein EYF80_037168 [Liparis tanakae]|uniref:Uncharacterized protein n=1 Tax=Liparis tanakae TaxID=230148 RepID=A0A4Z2GH14_9TELE|nr:hypothetical protein EYF80_037168 [Liparis tanakae]
MKGRGGNTGSGGVCPSQHESCSHLLPPLDVESGDKDLVRHVTAAQHKYWCSSDAPLKSLSSDGSCSILGDTTTSHLILLPVKNTAEQAGRDSELP